MKRLLVLLSVILLAGCAAKAEVKKNPEQFLYIVHATKGYYANGKLTLMNVSPAVSFFTDRPFRKAGTVDLIHFLQGWDTKGAGSFNYDPPNGGFVFYEKSGRVYSDVSVELSDPHYDAPKGVLVFKVHFLNESGFPNNKEMDQVTLFIDPK